jgi:septal ring factor EnvC (AmiA/AmiB activator)
MNATLTTATLMRAALSALVRPCPARSMARISGWPTLAMLSAMILSTPLPLAAQTAPQPAKATGSSTSPAATDSQSPQTPDVADLIKQHEKELEAAREQQKKAAETEARLQADIAAIGQDRNKLNAQLIEVAARVRTVETQIGDTESRLHGLDGREEQIRQSLNSRRVEITEVLAALQRAGRRTPPALLVKPEDALKSLRTAMLLGAVVPEMRSRAEHLVSDLSELVKIRTDIGRERDRLTADHDQSTADQQRLAALVEERQRKQVAAEHDMEAERTRAATLSKQVDNLQDLIAKMELDLKSAAKAAATASLQGAPATVNGKPNLGALKDPGRLSPAVAFASAKGLLPLPVNGTKIRGFGGSDGAGGVQRGITLATRTGAQVTTPCDGWVVYAGPFRSYGQLLILNAGGGYHVLLAGMERISVNIGQFVLTGEPVATMGTTSQVASILATAPSQPLLYIEFRKSGTPVDPGPWWTASEGEKVRG